MQVVFESRFRADFCMRWEVRLFGPAARVPYRSFGEGPQILCESSFRPAVCLGLLKVRDYLVYCSDGVLNRL